MPKICSDGIWLSSPDTETAVECAKPIRAKHECERRVDDACQKQHVIRWNVEGEYQKVRMEMYVRR